MELNKHTRAIAYFCFGLVGVVPLVQAKGYSPAVTAQPGGFAVKFASDGTPLAIPVSRFANGSIGSTGAVNVALPGGINYPAIGSAVLAAGAMLTPWGSLIASALAVGSVGVAVLDSALADAKISFKNGRAQKPDATAVSCASLPCPDLRGVEPFTLNQNGVSRVVSVPYVHTNYFEACKALASQGQGMWPAEPGFPLAVNRGGGPGYDCTIRWNSSQGGADYQIGTKPGVVTTPAYVDITVVEAAEIMTARPPSVAEVQALVDLNFAPLLAPPLLTGPASVFKGNTVQMGIDGTLTEIEERYVASFQPGVIGIGVQKVETVTSPQKVQTTTTTNSDGTTSTGAIITPSVKASVTSTAPIEKPAEDPCVTNPLRIGCAEIDTPEGVIPKTQKNVTYSAESMFGSSGCPPDVSIAQRVTGQPVVLSYTPTCNALATYVKPIVIAIALFMAYLIILPGGTRQ